MALDNETLAAAKSYTKKTVVGGGAIKGKNCTVDSIVDIEGGHRITFKWTLDDGTVQTLPMDVMDGVQGLKGEKGDRGAIGPSGAQGIQGVQGPAGPKGDTGAQGIQGVQGMQGVQGIQGPKGDDGYPFLIYKQYDDISEFDVEDFPEIGLMFMVMVEDYDPQDPTQSIGYPIYRYTGEGNPPYSLVVHLASQGIKGEKGDKGDKGDQGVPGQQGEQGAKGDKGEKGDTGAQGIQGEQGIGLPDGGLTGQVLAKYSNEDYDFDWMNTTDTVRPDSDALVQSKAVYSAINRALSSIYTPRGELSCAELTSALLTDENKGSVYEMSDAGETTALFINGAGKAIKIGDNVGIIKAGPNTYLFNLMANAFDLTDYQKKDLVSPVESQTTVEDALQALSGNKTSKVSNATAGNIAALDANGNLVDSGAGIKNGGGKVLALKGNDNAHPADLNDLTEAGVYSIISQGSSHLPNTEYLTWWQIMVITKSDTSANQGYCTQYAMARNNLVYMRDCEAGTWSPWVKLITETEFKSYGIKTIWTGSKTKGDTGMNFDSSPYDLCLAQVGGSWCRLTTGVGTGSTARKKFTSLYAGRDNTTNTPYEQYYVLDILGDGTVATCGWFDVSSMNIQNARLAAQQALSLAATGATWTDPAWKHLNNVETSVGVSKIIGIKFQART